MSICQLVSAAPRINKTKYVNIFFETCRTQVKRDGRIVPVDVNRKNKQWLAKHLKQQESSEVYIHMDYNTTWHKY